MVEALIGIGAGAVLIPWLAWVSVQLIGLKVRLAELSQNQSAIIERLDSGRERMADFEQRLRELEHK